MLYHCILLSAAASGGRSDRVVLPSASAAQSDAICNIFTHKLFCFLCKAAAATLPTVASFNRGSHEEEKRKKKGTDGCPWWRWCVPHRRAICPAAIYNTTHTFCSLLPSLLK